jgi:hypothetical protein
MFTRERSITAARRAIGEARACRLAGNPESARVWLDLALRRRVMLQAFQSGDAIGYVIEHCARANYRYGGRV